MWIATRRFAQRISRYTRSFCPLFQLNFRVLLCTVQCPDMILRVLEVQWSPLIKFDDPARG